MADFLVAVWGVLPWGDFQPVLSYPYCDQHDIDMNTGSITDTRTSTGIQYFGMWA